MHAGIQQTSGLRLDRKSAVISRCGVVPGSSENSFLFHRISGGAYGMQMPPTGPLRPEQINIIKMWIDQGADWPDSLANEVELPPLKPKAVAMVEALHAGDVAGFVKSASGDPQLLNARGPEGSTPFMYAVLYTGAPTLQQLLKLGADPNKRNDANATALMWAATDLEKDPSAGGSRRRRERKRRSQDGRRLRLVGARHRQASRRDPGGRIAGQVRRQGHGAEYPGPESPAGKHHSKRDPGQPAAHPACRRQFRSQGSLRELPQ